MQVFTCRHQRSADQNNLLVREQSSLDSPTDSPEAGRVGSVAYCDHLPSNCEPYLYTSFAKEFEMPKL